MANHEIALQAEIRKVSSIQTSYGSKHAPSSISNWDLSPELKQPPRLVYCSSPYSAEFMYEEIISPFPYTF
jgi:hypothetical protein